MMIFSILIWFCDSNSSFPDYQLNQLYSNWSEGKFVAVANLVLCSSVHVFYNVKERAAIAK